MANGDTAAGGLPMRIEEAEGLSHAPQRRHDQEKNYSPALKQTGGYSQAQSHGISEAERKKYCDFHKKAYDEIIDRFKSSEGIEAGATTSDLNEMIRLLNSYYGEKADCPSLPEVEDEPSEDIPTIAMKR